MLDLSPPLFVENVLAVEIYMEAKKSGEVRDVRVGTSHTKTLMYLRPPDVAALMDIYGVAKEARPLLYEKIRSLQNVDHEMSPLRSK